MGAIYYHYNKECKCLIISKFLSYSFYISINQITFLIYIFFIILIFNLCNQFFLGDSGAYFLSFFIGFILIKIYRMESLHWIDFSGMYGHYN